MRGAAEPQQRMLQQRQQRRRLAAVQCCFRSEPRENAGLRVHQRVAAGIVDRQIPAAERGDDAARQRAIRRHQRGGLAVFARLAQHNRNRQRLDLGIRRLDQRQAVGALIDQVVD